ncbi:MAG TPA: hypothetical protein VIU11_16620 [Nakamurella sp.]
MVTVEAVLRRNGIDIPETVIAEQLDALLRSGEPRRGVELSAADERFLATYSGVEEATPEQLRALRARSVAQVAAEAGRALTRGQVAELLGVDASRVSHQVAQGRLFVYSVGNRPAFPDWQFHRADESGSGGLPHLAEVIAAFPTGAHPVTVRSFMTIPDDDLTVGGRAQSPRDWLLSGGAPAAVVELARTLAEQV